MQLSKPAFIILIVYSILLLILLIATIASKSFSFGSVFGLIIGAGYIALKTYDTNCLTTGQCDIWAWVRTVLNIIIPSIIIIIVIAGMFQKPKEDTTTTTTTTTIIS